MSNDIGQDPRHTPVPAHAWPAALHMGIIVLVGVAVLIPRLGQTQHITGREGRHAEIAREMAATHKYVVPFALGQPYFLKPPLFQWTVVAAFQITRRVDFFTARLPSVFWTVVGGLAIYLLGRRWLGPRAGLWAALMWFAFPLVYEWARMVQMDMMLAALVTVGVLLALCSAASPRPAAQWGLWIAACVMASAGTLAKGPQALFYFLLGAAAIWRVYRRRWLPRPAFLAAGLCVVLLLCGGWVLAAEARYPGYMQQLIAYQFGKGLADHQRRVYLYVDQLLVRSAPWALFGIGALYADVRALRKRGLTTYTLPAVVFLVAFIAMTLFPSKREHYLLPILPFWALMIGGFLDRCATAEGAAGQAEAEAPALGRRSRWWLFEVPLWVILAVPVLALPIAVAVPQLRATMGIPAIIVGAALMTVSAWGLLSLRRGRHERAIWAILAATLFGVAALDALFVGARYPENTSVAVARQIGRQIPAGAPVASYGVTHETLFFALNRPVAFLYEEAKLRDFLQKPGTRYVLVDVAQAPSLQALAAGAVEKVGQWELDGHDIWLLRSGAGGANP